MQLGRALSKETEDVANAVNSRTCGIYSNVSTPIGDTFFFASVSASRVASLVAAIPLGSTTIQTQIQPSGSLRVVRIYGVANSATQCVPLPYINSSTLADSIGLSFNPTNGVITITTTTSNWAAYSAVVVVEYLYLS